MTFDDAGSGGEVLPFTPRPRLTPPTFDDGESLVPPSPLPAPPSVGDPAAPSSSFDAPSLEPMAPPLSLLMPPITAGGSDDDEGGLVLPAPEDPDNPGVADAAATGMTLAAAVGVAAAAGLWHGAVGLRARAAHRRALADKARAAADKTAGGSKASKGTTTSSKRSLNSGGAATKRGGGGRPGGGSGKRGNGKAPSGRGGAAKGPGRSGDGGKRSWKGRGKDSKDSPATRAERRAARRAAKADKAAGGKAASGSKGAAGTKGSGGKKSGSTSKSGRGKKHGKSGSGRGRGRSWGRTRLGRATRNIAHRAAAGARAGGRDWRTGVDGGAKILAGKAAAKLPHRKAAEDTTTAGKPVDLTKPDKDAKPVDDTKPPVDATETKDPKPAEGAEKTADDGGQAPVDDPTKPTTEEPPAEKPDAPEEAHPDPEPDDPRIDDPGFWARERYEEPTPPPGWEWMRPPPAADQTWKWKGAERADRPPVTEVRPALPAGDSGSAGSTRPEPQAPAPQGDHVNAPQTQYRDADLTIYDVIEADAEMAEEILGGVDEARHTAEGCDRLYLRLEELYATVLELRVPGILASAVLWLMDKTGTVKYRAQAIAEKLPAASEGIAVAGSNAAARHQGLADAVKDAGHTRPAERDYHTA